MSSLCLRPPVNDKKSEIKLWKTKLYLELARLVGIEATLGGGTESSIRWGRCNLDIYYPAIRIRLGLGTVQDLGNQRTGRN